DRSARWSSATACRTPCAEACSSVPPSAARQVAAWQVVAGGGTAGGRRTASEPVIVPAGGLLGGGTELARRASYVLRRPVRRRGVTATSPAALGAHALSIVGTQVEDVARHLQHGDARLRQRRRDARQRRTVLRDEDD